MGHRREDLNAVEISNRIAKYFNFLLELEERLTTEKIRPDKNLRILITSNIDYLQIEETKYTTFINGRKSQYYDDLLNAADRVILFIDSKLEQLSKEENK